MRAKLILTMTAIVMCGAGANTVAAQTTVRGSVLTSTQFPPVIMRFDEGLEHVGSTEFVLYGVADAAIHLFAELEDGRVERLYWIQFEGYLPTVDRTYDYSDSQGRTRIGDHDYYEDAWVWNLNTARIRPGSDTERVLDLIRERGLMLGPELIGLRLVRLDGAARNELMIVYLEDLSVSGLSPGALGGGDRPRVVEALRTRALGSVRIEERASSN